MRAKVQAGAHPWIDSYNILVNNWTAQSNVVNHVQGTLQRGNGGGACLPADNYQFAYYDTAEAYQLALRWKITGDNNYANAAIGILNAWATGCTNLCGDPNIQLLEIYGYQFACAGEVMRSYTNWAAADVQRFQVWMVNLWEPMDHSFLSAHQGACSTHTWANWDLCSMASMMAIGILCDQTNIYNEALTYFKAGIGNGNIEQAIYYMHPGYMGQGQEMGRDQGHAGLNVALIGVICQMAYNQGDDLFAYENNRVLSSCEYFAKFNVGQSVPYLTFNNCDPVNQTTLGSSSQGDNRPCWDLIYNHYVNLKGMAAPWSQQYAARNRPDGGGSDYGEGGGYDQLGFTTLTCSLDPIVVGANPSGLTAKLNGPQQVQLNWWGTANATNYLVKRGTTSGGPYTTIATITTNLLTYTDTSVTNGVTYYYTISALTPLGESGNGNEGCVSVQPQLVAYYKFDESSGTSASDAAGNGWTGTLNGAAWVSGLSNNAVNLNGSSQYVTLPNSITTNLADFTIAAWVYLNGSQGYWARIFDFGAEQSAVWGSTYYSTPTRYMFLAPESGNMRFAITLGTSGGEQHVDGNQPMPVNGWHHVAVTLAGSTGTMYLDGLQIGQNTINITPSQLGTTTQNCIGRSQWSGDPYLNGKVDDFRIYNGALSAAQIAALVASYPVQPAAPTNIVATAVSANQINLTWSPSLRATNYYVRRSAVSGGPYTTISAPLTVTNFSDAGLVGGTTYYYVIAAANDGGWTNSAEVSATTLSAPPAPASLMATGGLSGTINLSWSVSASATSYNVLRANFSGGPYTVIATGVTSINYADTGLVSLATYYYVVAAANMNGLGTNSVEASAVSPPLPNVPTGLVAVAGNASMQLSWVASTNAASYNVKRSTTSGGGYVLITNVTGTSFGDTGLANGTTYYYVVSSVSATGESTNSSEVAVQPNASAGTILGWSGAISGIWDTTTSNWLNSGASVKFTNGNTAVFNDSGANSSISLSSALSPSVIFMNNSSMNYTFSGGAISGTGSLTKQGSGSLTLNNANAYSGGTSISGGTVTVGNNSAFGTGAISLAGGTLFGGASGYTLANAIQIQTNTTTTMDCSGNLTLNGNLTGGGTVIRGSSAPQTLYLGGNNSGFTGVYQDQNNGNSITRWTSPNAGSANARWIFNQAQANSRTTPNFGTGTIQFGSISGGGYLYQNSSGTATVQVGALGLNDTFSGSMQDGAGVMALTKVGAGTLNLTGANTYSGLTTIGGGTLVVSTLSTGAGGYTVANGATLGVTVISGGTLTMSALSLGNSTNNYNGIGTVAAAITNTGGLTLAGTVTVNIGGSLSAGQYPLISSAAIGGSGGFVVGTVPTGLRGSIVTNGNTIVLALSNAGPTAAGTGTPNPVNLGGAVLLTVTVTNGASPTITNVTVDASAIGGSSSFNLVSAGGNMFTNTLIVTSATAYGSPLSLPVAVTDSNALSATNNIQLTVNSPTLFTWGGGAGNWSASNWMPNNLATPLFAGPTNGANLQAVVTNGPVTVNVAGGVGGLGSIVLANGGTMLVHNATYGGYANLLLTGGTLDTVDNGSYHAYGASVLSAVTAAGLTSSTIATSGGSWYNLGGQNVTNQSIFTVSNGATLNVVGALKDAIAANDNNYLPSGLIKLGSGTLVLSGASVYAGPTTVSNGEVLVPTAFAGNGSFFVANGAMFGVTNSSAASATVSNLTLAAGSGLEFFHVASTTQPLLLASNVTVSGNSTVNIAGATSLVSGSTYPLVNYTGAFSGNFSSLQLQMPYGWSGTLVNNAGQIAVSVAKILAPVAPTGLSAIAGDAQVGLNWNTSSGATSYNVKRATVSGGPYSTVTNVATTIYTDIGLSGGTTYYYVVSALNAGGESANSAQASAIPIGKFTGSVIGSPGSWSNLGNTITNAFDGNTNSYYDAANASGDWAGKDLGSGVAGIVTEIKYCPRAGFAGRMVGGQFQGANVADFSGGVVTLFAIATAPTEGMMTAQTVTNATAFRYLRYLGPANGYCNVSEVELWGTNGTPPVAPSVPTGLAAIAANAQVTLTWNTSSGATSYNLKRATVNGGPYATIASLTGTSYTDMSVVNGTTYYYVATALNTGGESANSSQVSATPQVPAPSAPTGLAATPAYLQITLSWNSSSGATSYNVKRATVNGGPYNTITNVTTTSFTDGAITMGTIYYYVISAVNAGGESANSSQVNATSLTLPSPWSTMDVGAVGIAGSAVYSNSIYTVSGSGADTWGNSDQFRYVYQLGGTNCSVTAEVLAMTTNSSAAAKAGVMIRETLATNSVMCEMQMMALNGAENLWRASTGGNVTGLSTAGLHAPYWVRITRSGSKFVSYRSPDGTTWTPMSTNTIAMASSVNIGLFVCGHNNIAICTATLTNAVASP